jgi:RNA polymerase sigma-70 factor (ECF subfamily)
MSHVATPATLDLVNLDGESFHVAARPSRVPQRDEPLARETDHRLAERIRAGDREAFSQLYQQTREPVYRYILSRIQDPFEAEDLTQETFFQAYRSIGSFEGRSCLQTWLFGIARYTTLRFYRFSDRWMIGGQGVQVSGELASESRTEDRVEAMLALERCDVVLGEICSDDNQSIFNLRYGDAKSVRDIAVDVGKTPNAVKASLQRSRQVLQRTLRFAG